MPIKIMFSENGPFALVETPEEALALLKAHGNSLGQLSLKTGSPVPTLDSIGNFFSAINANARKFLKLLAKHPDGVKGELFAQEAGFSVEKFGGILGGASKLAKRFGISFKKIVISEMKIEGTQRYRFLRPGPLLMQYLQELERATVEVK